MAKTRSLEAINKKLFKGASSLQATLEGMLETRRPLAVLEIGCGAGRALMELALAFRHEPVRFYGINRELGNPISSSADLARVAREYDLDVESAGAEWQLPELFFYDATTLHFSANSIDLIYLSSVARFIEHKAEFIEEVCRVLTPGGVAIIQLSRSGWDYPEGEIRDDLLVTRYPSRLVLTHGRDLVPLPKYLKQFAETGVEFEFISTPACVLRVTKRQAGRLSLGLEYDTVRSVPMTQLPYGQEDVREARGGFRSVYRVSDEGYKAMLDRLARLPARDSPTGGSEESQETSLPLTTPKPPRTVTSYRVGQRVKVKGKRGEGRSFRASKIRPNDDGLEWEELEGGVEWVDAATGTFGLLGCTVYVDAEYRASDTWDRAARGALRRGTLAKVSGSFRDGRFAPERLVIKEPHAVIVEEIQGAISSIDAASACLEVAGFTVRVDARTRIVTE
ncbi:MAG: class I SAM-dependent methyltransferase [Acidobacteria bacterium]|nr:MAG: class I SAM-dependent methyltransferase [Acidobacteriota bacterium]